MRNKTQLYRKVREALQSEQVGLYCVFVPINSKRAIKLYHDRNRRDSTYNRQKAAYKLRLAPKPGPLFQYRDKFGYWTEKVKLFTEKFEGYEYFRLYNRKDSPAKPVVEYLRNKLGWNWTDYHDLNWGIRRGKYVPIDFDDL